MKFWAAWLGVIMVLSSALARPAEEPKVIAKVTPLPVALNKDFQFRKTKLYFLSDAPLQHQGGPSSVTAGGKQGGVASSSKGTATQQDASITFERQYRLFGAITVLDKNQLYGNYFDFFWRVRGRADVTVRLEYRQVKLHAHVQAQEISYANVHGTHRTEFKVAGHDYIDDGRVTAWRCLLIENGTIVAENRSYLWE
jgi:hypothetical protein